MAEAFRKESKKVQKAHSPISLSLFSLGLLFPGPKCLSSALLKSGLSFQASLPNSREPLNLSLWWGACHTLPFYTKAKFSCFGLTTQLHSQQVASVSLLLLPEQPLLSHPDNSNSRPGPSSPTPAPRPGACLGRPGDTFPRQRWGPGCAGRSLPEASAGLRTPLGEERSLPVLKSHSPAQQPRGRFPEGETVPRHRAEVDSRDGWNPGRNKFQTYSLLSNDGDTIRDTAASSRHS